MPKAVPESSRPYFPELDGIRAIAALMIMSFHLSQIWVLRHNLIVGQTGVDLFFVLSGFLITTILLGHTHGDWSEVRNFYIRRTLRIFPLYYGYLIGISVLASSVSLYFWFYLENFALARGFLGVQGPNHFWSLAVEEQFYLVWPFLVLFWPRRWLVQAMWGVVSVAALLRVVLPNHPQDFLFYFTFTRMDALAAGGLLAFYYSRDKLVGLRPVLSGILVASLALLGAGAKLSHGTDLGWVQVTKYTAAAGIFSASIGLLISSSNTPIHTFLCSKPMRAVGRVSYGLYVFHPLVFEFFKTHLMNFSLALRVVVAFSAVYIVSLFSFQGFEKHFTDLKQRLAPEKRFKAYDLRPTVPQD